MKFIQNIILNRYTNKEDLLFFETLKKILGFRPNNLSIYKKAFIHRSLKQKDINGNPLNYERLEFLGDAILGAVISSYLFKEAPFGDEGYLTQIRSKIVSRKHLNQLGRDLRLISLLKTDINNKFGENTHGNIFEALVGAIYLDKGYSACHEFIFKQVINPYVDISKLESKITSYKKLLIEWVQKQKRTFNFESFEDTGNNKNKHFSVQFFIDDKLVSKGRATSKKKAEEIASKRAYYRFQKEINN